MGLDVPDGAAPEQPREVAPPAKSSAADASTNKNRNSKKGLLILTSLGLLALAGLLIGILPDWDQADDVSPLVEEEDASSDDLPNGMNYYESKDGPFDVKLPLFSPDIMNVYDSMEDVQYDLQNLARFLLNDAITDNIARGDQHSNHVSAGDGGDFTAPVAGDVADIDADELSATLGAAEGVNDFETNNQEENMDRGDLAKSNGELVFVAYGDSVLVIKAEDGTQVDRIEIPPIVLPEGNDHGGSGATIDAPPGPDGNDHGVSGGTSPDAPENATAVGLEEPFVIEENMVMPPPMTIEDLPGPDGNDHGFSGGTSPDAPGTAPTVGLGEPFVIEDSMVMPPYQGWNPTPYIKALFIEGNRLAVVASGYSVEHSVGDTIQPILWNFQDTKIHLYDITDDGTISYVSSTTLNGSYQNGFSRSDEAGEYDAGYVVVQAGINTWDHLTAHVQRWHERFAGLSDAEYLEAAVLYASEEVIPNFIANLTAALKLTGAGSIDLTRLSLYADTVSANGDSGLVLLAGGVPNAVTHVVSFDMSEEIAVEGDPLTIDVSATFQPGNWGHVYAHEQMIIVADQGWNWSEDDQLSAQYTYLLGFSLDGPTSNHAVVGSIPGHILSSYSIDFDRAEDTAGQEGNYIRVATTQNFWNGGGGGGGGIIFAVDDMDLTVDNTAAETEIAPAEEEQESSTLNQIFVLKFPDSLGSDSNENVLTVVGQVELGKPNERFTTVRFFDDVAYAVTFEQIDPFYVVDFSEDPETPVVKGELEVLGFSEYLHPVDGDGTILAAVGQLADENGQIQGMQISLFDAQDPVNPALLARLPITGASDTSWSSSSVSWDPRAFRYVKFDDISGYLIMPLSTYTISSGGEPKNFEGFVVFSIDLSLPEGDMISEVLSIDHTDSATFADSFWYCSSLPERSFVIDGHLITMKSHSMVSTDLVSSGEAWTVDVDEMAGGCPIHGL